METSAISRMKTERLLLRQIVASDIGHIFKGLSDPEIIKYYGVNFQSLEATKEQMTFYADLEKNGTGKYNSPKEFLKIQRFCLCP